MHQPVEDIEDDQPADEVILRFQSKAVKKRKKFIRDHSKLRQRLGLSQHEYWSRIGACQASGSKYEKGEHKVPRSVTTLAHLIYIQGLDIDARDYQ